jgi:hypothetical protein
MASTWRSALITSAALSLGSGIVAAVAFAPASSAAEMTVSATADTYTRVDTPNVNYGSSVRMSVQGDAGYNRHSLIRFASVTVPGGQEIVAAKVRLTVDSTTGAGAVSLYKIAGGWTETGVTWATEPARGASLGGRTVPASGAVDFDATGALTARTGTSDVNVRLETTAPGYYGFKTAQGGVAPQLILTTQPVSSPTPTTSPSTTPTTGSDDGTEAAKLHNWGAIVAGDEFATGAVPDSTKWQRYNGPGHNGKGVRSPAAWSVQNGYARVSGTSAGTTGGMSAKYAGSSRKYGRWEVRLRASNVEQKYHFVSILWPESGSWPCDGEIDYAEKPGTSMTQTGFYNHFDCTNQQTSVKKVLDVTQWHNYAVEWTSAGVVGYVDGVEWFRDRDTAHLPPGPMHQTLQLDWFPVSGQATKASTADFAWVRQYNLGAGPTASPTSIPSPTATATPTVTPTATVTPSPTATSTPVPTTTYTFGAAGDMNGPGTYATSSASGKNAASISAQLASGGISNFFGLGDFQYDTAYCADYTKYWDVAGWAKVKPRTYWLSAPNHDWQPGRNEDLDNFMNGECAGDTVKSAANVEKGRIANDQAYSFDKGRWHFAMLPTGLWRFNPAKAATTTTWLDNDLAAAKARGQFLAVSYHDPYFTSTTSAHGRSTEVKPWVDVIDKYDVRFTLSGSQHNYERSCPVLKDDSCTALTGTGTQAFNVSTGGIGLRTFTDSQPSYLAKRFTGTWGWIKFTLRNDGSYDWHFIATSGTTSSSNADSGTRPAP